MPAYCVERSIIIDAPLTSIRDSLTNFRQWPAWSPWLIMEPEAQLTFNEKQGQIGAAYEWQGKLVGAGSMELVGIEEQRLEMDLQFIKPFKSTARVSFDLHPEDGSTQVTWRMDSHLPFFLFWMIKNIKAYIGMDYERGLRMLKDYIETGHVPSKLSLEGASALQSQPYIGIANECEFDAMSEVMPQDFQTLYQFLQENNLSTHIVPFAIYNRFDIFQKRTQFISAVPVDRDLAVAPPFIKGELAPGEVLKVKHIGPYRHLGNAWSLAFNYARNKKIKTKKTPVGIEFYLNDPAQTQSEALETEVALYLK